MECSIELSPASLNEIVHHWLHENTINHCTHKYSLFVLHRQLVSTMWLRFYQHICDKSNLELTFASAILHTRPSNFFRQLTLVAGHVIEGLGPPAHDSWKRSPPFLFSEWLMVITLSPRSLHMTCPMVAWRRSTALGNFARSYCPKIRGRKAAVQRGV